MTSKTIAPQGFVPAVPKDPELLGAVGKVAIHNTHLEMELKMWVKTLAGIRPDEARRALQYMPISQIRKLVVKLSKKRISDEAARLRIRALIQRAAELSEIRNSLLHGYWAREMQNNDEFWLVQAGETAIPAPTTNDVQKLADEMVELWNTLNHERNHGFVRIALLPPSKDELVGEARDDA